MAIAYENLTPPQPPPARIPFLMDGTVMSRRNVFNHPRPRTKRDWRDEVERVRVEARVTLDAFVSGRLGDAPELAARLRWLVRVAIEHRKMLVEHELGIRFGSRFTRAWVFRPFSTYSAKSKVARGDVFCLFCHEPLRTYTPRFGALAVTDRQRYPNEIDYGRLRDVHEHTTKCALLFVAGMIEGAPWGSVRFPDPEAPL